MDEPDLSSYLPWLALVIVLLAIGLYLYRSPSPSTPPTQYTSTFNLTPTKRAPSAPPHELMVNSWKTYTNDKYSFSVDEPAGWNEEEYPAPFPQGGTIYAFSSDELPCKTCTYLGTGFLEVRVYTKKDNPNDYATFQQIASAVGKSQKVQAIQVSGLGGVFFNNSYYIENQGTVYQFSLGKNTQPTETNIKIFQHVVASFKYMGLIFK